jgi:glycosyltransferase involved in cell wall biosynthesis
MILACIKGGARHVFLCHYQTPSTFFTALLLRLMGRRVYVMNDSKFDDYARSLWLELAKAAFYLPYAGAVAGSERTKDYMRFLGMRRDRIEAPYNAISVARISQSYALDNSPDVAFDDRHFTIVARLVRKKNIATAIAAYALYYRNVSNPRSLHIYGSGPLDIELQTQAKDAGLAGQVHFHGFVQAADIAEALHHSLALLLPSVEEQFGLAALEALCAGVPVILSRNCGVCDAFVRTGVNGFIVEPMNVEGFAFFLTMLTGDEALWSRMRAAARLSAGPGDVKCFAAAVERLIDKTS